MDVWPIPRGPDGKSTYASLTMAHGGALPHMHGSHGSKLALVAWCLMPTLCVPGATVHELLDTLAENGNPSYTKHGAIGQTSRVSIFKGLNIKANRSLNNFIMHKDIAKDIHKLSGQESRVWRRLATLIRNVLNAASHMAPPGNYGSLPLPKDSATMTYSERKFIPSLIPETEGFLMPFKHRTPNTCIVLRFLCVRSRAETESLHATDQLPNSYLHAPIQTLRTYGSIGALSFYYPLPDSDLN
ncbi:hypothetical protein VNO77_31186 [Canavalia gladiata]|uniref:Uncharacterized protein n=1 Tax=Canavalia gladiata TaxID=3824 RepID=A0AAN9Q1P0_CANGL